jgi:putative hydrolase of the HAD superfamily
MPIRVVSFDVGETLLRPYPGFGQIVLNCCRDEGDVLDDDRAAALERYSEAVFADLRRKGETFSLTLEQSRQVWTGIYRGFLVSEGFSAERAAYLTERIYHRFLDHSSYRLFDDALPTLADLRDRGLQLGVISNWESWLPGLLVTTGLGQYLSFQIVSGQVGFEKPDPRIFRAAIAAAGVDPASVLHVGDSPTSDVQGAISAGLSAVLLDRLDRNPNHGGHRISTLSALFDLPELAGRGAS